MSPEEETVINRNTMKLQNHLYKALKQRDQYKKELHHCKAELESHQTNLKQRREALEYTKAEVKKYKSERDTLIDDIAVLKANDDRYRKRAENAMDYAERSQCEVLRLEQIRDIKDSALKGAEIKIKTLKQENENLTNRVRKLNLTAQTEHDELMSSDSEVRYWKNLYTTLTDHIRLKAENNPGVSRYIDLVNYIDRLEQK